MGNPADSVKQKLDIKWVEAKRLVQWSKEELGIPDSDECPRHYEDEVVRIALEMYNLLSPEDRANMKSSSHHQREPYWRQKAIEQAMKREEQWAAAAAANGGGMRSSNHSSHNNHYSSTPCKGNTTYPEFYGEPTVSQSDHHRPKSSLTVSTEAESVITRVSTKESYDADEELKVTKVIAANTPEAPPTSSPTARPSPLPPVEQQEVSRPPTPKASTHGAGNNDNVPQMPKRIPSKKPDTVKVVTCYCDIL